MPKCACTANNISTVIRGGTSPLSNRFRLYKPIPSNSAIFFFDSPYSFRSHPMLCVNTSILTSYTCWML